RSYHGGGLPAFYKYSHELCLISSSGIIESPIAPIMRALQKMLRRGVKSLLGEVESFSSLVDDLRGLSWRLFAQESHLNWWLTLLSFWLLKRRSNVTMIR
ncbi:hypothetical protein A2U01_0015443, partial [Trifolium medium]|nr:hypothetical protein [Trifolium medium]